jgi:Uma2 family endonuclease
MQATESVVTPHLFTVEEYMKLDIDDRTELIEGVIYDVSPKNEPHSRAVSRLTRALARGLSDEFSVRIQDPIAVDGWTGKNAPEIDVAVVAEKRYETTPTSNDALAFIEVSDTTYASDKRRKIPLYLTRGVPVWHVNIPARRVEFYDRGADLRYPRVFAEADEIDILGVVIPVASLFE